jgi:hypothetical protein
VCGLNFYESDVILWYSRYMTLLTSKPDPNAQFV